MFTAAVRANFSAVQAIARSRLKLGITISWRRYVHGARGKHHRPTMEGQFVVRKLSEAPDEKRRVIARAR